MTAYNLINFYQVFRYAQNSISAWVSFERSEKPVKSFILSDLSCRPEGDLC